MNTDLGTKRLLFKIIRRHQSEGELKLKDIRIEFKKHKKLIPQQNTKRIRSFSLEYSLDDIGSDNTTKPGDCKISKRLFQITEFPCKSKKNQ